MLKKTTLAVLGLVTSTLSFAGTMGPVCTPGDVTVPCEARAWDLGVQALYLKTSFNSNRNYIAGDFFNYEDELTDWDWGFRLEGSYHFNTGNDFTVDWTHYKNDFDFYRVSGLLPLAQLNVGTSFAVENRFDQVNAVLGQHVDFGLVKDIRFYGGLQYANIKANNARVFSPQFLPAALALGTLSSFDNADFNGVGPVAGIDYSYDLTPAFSLTANGAGSILYGTTRFNNGFGLGPLAVLASSGSKRQLVPSLQAKLGLNYAYMMSQGALNLQLGYEVMNYFNVFLTPAVGIFAPIANSDFGLYGPYLGLKYVGNV